MDEFDTIARLFRPLATSPEALNLADDAALLTPRSGYDLVVTTDTLVEGVHFLPDDPPFLLAQKLLRVNLSDLAAKGASPYGYLLNLAWSPGWDGARRTAFAQGLAEDQARFDLKLFGGDTVSTPGPLTIGATLFGWVESGRMVRRGGARAGDLVLVSGVIGDGALGLKARQGELTELADAVALVARYQRPEPRLNLAAVLRRYATAAADVSDGLLADAGHIGEASGAGVEIELSLIPLSAAGRAFGDLVALATGGDDYEIVCTARPDDVAPMLAAAAAAGTPLTVIGRVMEGQGLRTTLHGGPFTVERLGWRHG